MRQYANTDQWQSEAKEEADPTTAAPTRDALRIAAFADGNEAQTRSLSALVTDFEGTTEDVSVTARFHPEELAAKLAAISSVEERDEQRLHLLPRVSKSASKLGLKLSPRVLQQTAGSSDDRLLQHLLPILAERTTTKTTPGKAQEEESMHSSIKNWLAESAVVPHPVSNVQIGEDFVTLYRHAHAYGFLDPEEPSHLQSMRHAMVTKRPSPREAYKEPAVVGMLRGRGLAIPEAPYDDDAHTKTTCEQGREDFYGAFCRGLVVASCSRA